MSVHVMLDIETLGVQRDALILSIGAVKFDPRAKGEAAGDPILSRFHVGIDANDNHDKRSIDISTVNWWARAEQRAAWDALAAMEKVSLGEALDGLVTWCGPDSLLTWANAPTFDCTILRHAFAQYGFECPWKFYHERCYRTLNSLVPKDLGPQRTGTHHNAVDDATHQAQRVAFIAEHLDLELG